MTFPTVFRHSTATRLWLTAFLLASLLAMAIAFQLPGELGYLAGGGVTLIAAVLFHRWYLTFRWVELTHETVRFHHPWGSRELAFRDILRARFDTSPHDLILTAHEREYRVPRTLQGFQKAHDAILRQAGLDGLDALPLEVRTKRSFRAAGLIAGVEVVLCGVLLFRNGLHPFNVAFCLSLLLSAAVILDQCVLRRTRWEQDGLWVHGIFGQRFFQRTDLISARVTKHTLWSRMQLEFAGGRKVTLEDKISDVPVVHIARLLEHEWGAAILGAGQLAAANRFSPTKNS